MLKEHRDVFGQRLFINRRADGFASARYKQDTGDPVQTYLVEIGQMPLLTREQEVILGIQVEGYRLLREIDGSPLQIAEVLVDIIRFRSRLIRDFVYSQGIEQTMPLSSLLVHPQVRLKIDGDLSLVDKGDLLKEVSTANHILEGTFTKDNLASLINDGDLNVLLGSEADLGKFYATISSTGKDAVNRFIEANLRLVVAIVRSTDNKGVDILDLIQEGNIGLIRAVEMFDYRRGNKFSTYATWWIKQGVDRAIKKIARTIRVSIPTLVIAGQAHRARRLLANELRREPTHQEIGELMQLSEDKVRFILDDLDYKLKPVSLDKIIGERDAAHLRDLVDHSKSLYGQQDEEDDLEGGVIRRSLRWKLEQGLKDMLSPREQEVIRERFGFDDNNPKVRSKIGERMEITGERVRQIEAEALEKLQGLPARDYIDYLS